MRNMLGWMSLAQSKWSQELRKRVKTLMAKIDGRSSRQMSTRSVIAMGEAGALLPVLGWAWAESFLTEKAVSCTCNGYNSRRKHVRKYVVGCHVTIEIC